jgi:hypothetical protein
MRILDSPNREDRELRVGDKFSSPEGSRSRRDAELPRHDQSEDFPRAYALYLPAELRIHTDGGAAATHRASSDDNEFLTCLHGQRAEGLLSAVFQNQRDGLTQIRKALFTRLALAVSARNFRAVRDIPRAILFDDRCEFVAHASF